MEGMAETTPLAEQLVLSLEQATHMAKQLHATTNDPTHLLQIYTSLHQAHHHLSTFLSKTQFPPPPPAAENSPSSATGAVTGDENDIDPMQIMDGDDAVVEEAEENSKGIVERVEEKMRNCFIKNKRPKRRLSPSAAAVAEERRLNDDGDGWGVKGFDPHATRLRALDLVYQFHG